MRFSAAFTLPLPLPAGAQPGGVAPGRTTGTPSLPVAPPAETARDLPDDLDARARLVGEWQFGEPD